MLAGLVAVCGDLSKGSMGRGWKLGSALAGELPLRRVLAGCILGLECLLVWFFLSSRQGSSRHSQNDIPSVAAHRSLLILDSPALHSRFGLFGRRLFPYSVIPGGVENGIELRQAITNDPVISAHYAGFTLAKARVILADQERAVYVSYRLDNHVYWTRQKLRLAKGEALITDGKITARTRCGNQISEIPLAPSSPAEPAIEALEKPEDPLLLAELNPPFELPLDPPPTTDIQVIGHAGRFFLPPLLPVYLGNPGSSPGIPISPPPQPSVPEPATLLLVSIGLCAICMTRKK